MRLIKEQIHIIILAAASFLTRFIFFGYPKETVFDEVHFGKFVSGYFNGEYFFDIHPPLAKLLITGFGAICGYRPTMDFGKIGELIADNADFIWLRFLPTLAGALLPIVIYFICRALNFSKIGSFVAGILVVLENSLVVHSRFILLDGLLLLFEFGSLLFYFLYQKQTDKKISWLLFSLAVASASFAISVKWTGASFFALILGLEFARLFKTKINFRDLAVKACLFLIIPFTIYFLSFAVHFALLFKTGPGRDFMSPGFQKTLQGSQYQNDDGVSPLGLFAKFTELNRVMYSSGMGIDASHPYSSKWYTWPVMQRPIYYWVQSDDTASNGAGEKKTAKIYLLGNPIIYWLGGLSLIFFIFYLVFLAGGGMDNLRKRQGVFLPILSGFFINFLPFMFLGRVTFLYYYFPSLIFSIIIIAYLIDEIKSRKIQKATIAVLVLVSAIAFIYFSPLTYGLPLTRGEQEARFWFKSWE